MNSPTQAQSGYGFVTGLLTGACVGTGLALWLAPRSGGEGVRDDDVAQAVASLENEGNPPHAARVFPAPLGRDSSRPAPE
jgi:hypothetical protein